MNLTKEISREEFAAILERNGSHTAAADVLAGLDYRGATEYIAGKSPRYADAEGIWLHDYINRLHGKGKA